MEWSLRGLVVSRLLMVVWRDLCTLLTCLVKNWPYSFRNTCSLAATHSQVSNLHSEVHLVYQFSYSSLPDFSVVQNLSFLAHHNFILCLFCSTNWSSLARIGKFTDVAFRINTRTVATSPSCMCVVPLLNFGKCFKAHFLLRRVPMLSGPEVGSILSVRMQERVLKLYLQRFVQVRTDSNHLFLWSQ